jgi:curlin associated repeat protein
VGETNDLEIRQRGRTNDAGALQDGEDNYVDLDQRRGQRR